MIVKEAGYPSLERRCLLQIADGTGAVEELPLELRGNGIPAHKHGCAQRLQNLLFFLGKGSTVVVILSPLNRLIEINCHPFFVFGSGGSAGKRETSQDGHELRFAVNYLAGFLLTRVLLPLVMLGKPARIVNVSSLGQHPIDFDDVMLTRGAERRRIRSLPSLISTH
jgi:hypothetical protein